MGSAPAVVSNPVAAVAVEKEVNEATPLSPKSTEAADAVEAAGVTVTVTAEPESEPAVVPPAAEDEAAAVDDALSEEAADAAAAAAVAAAVSNEVTEADGESAEQKD